MEIPWLIIFASLCVSLALKSLLSLIHQTRSNTQKLPPGPPRIPILSDLLLLRRNSTEFERELREIRSKYGPIVTLKVGRRKAVFITNHDLAYKTLVQNGATFADRPPGPESGRIISSNRHNISSAAYGPLWRLLRRNLTSEILHPSRVKSYTHARKWVLEILNNKLKTESESGRPVRVVDHFQYAMFCLLVLMCFGEKLEEKVIREIENAQRNLILGFTRFSVLAIFPKLSKIIFRNRWSKLFELRSNQERVLLPLIKARREKKKLQHQQRSEEEEERGHESSFVVAYVDTLLNLSLPEDGGRKLNDSEIVSLCSEFLNAGTDTTSTALQWIMANLVKHQDIQAKLFEEIDRVSRGPDEDEIKEEDLQKMPYLKAVVLEGLRRHPPGHFVLPHAVTEDVSVEGYLVPKDASINFMVAEMGWDAQVWEDPMEFKPERFLMGKGRGEGEVFDITGSREIKMMPFGAGRRICPGLGLAMLHLEYFVANLVREFKWTAIDGDEVDLSEKQEFTIVMKYPLSAHISPRTA